MTTFVGKFLQAIFGNKAEKDIKKLRPIVSQINGHYESFKNLDNDSLRNKTLEFKSRIKKYTAEIDAKIEGLEKEAIDAQDILVKEDIYDSIDVLRKERDKKIEEGLKEILPEAFAVVKETAFRFSNNSNLSVTATDRDRDIAASKGHVTIDGNHAIWKNSWQAAGSEITWNMIHYDVQLIGGIVLHEGKIAEMQTGEGKTLVATLPTYLNALAGEGLHVVTVNDYLAKRDSEWVAPIFQFLHLSIDCIDKYRPNTQERRNAYLADITYGTNNEFGFDYLRDNMVRSENEKVQRKYHFAIVDEVDSVLVDEARTPLIISGPIPKGDEQEYLALKPRIERLVATQRQLVTQLLADAKKKIAEGNSGNQEGDGGLDLFRAYRGLPKNRPLTKFLSEEGVKSILQKTENHYLQEQGRKMPEADEPLFFTIEEKTNQVQLTDKGVKLLSTGVDEHFFVMPDIATSLAKIDGLELSKEDKLIKKEEILQDYSIKASRIHSINQLLKAYTLFEKDDHYIVADGKVKIIDEQTGRTMEGRRYSDGLHQALEAKENVTIEDATQTYATVTLQNYFRMYHKLCGMTGTAETEASEFWEIYKLEVVVIPTNKPISRNDKDDLIYRSEREKYTAIIEDIIKLSNDGRPVLVGTTSVEISEKLSRILTMRSIKHNVLNAKHHQNEAFIVAEAGKKGNVTIATNMAGRGTDIKISDEVKSLGGLAIIGTERHDSRRVDRQLRGRAGRQGDPGSSQFYVSFEDKLMRLFNSERMTSIMDRMGYKEGEVIQHPMASKSIERAQKRVEENNFGIRKRLLEYDDVMNIQREAIYKRRNNALKGDRLSVDLNSMFVSLSEEIVESHHSRKDYEDFLLDVLIHFGVETSITEKEFTSTNPKDLSERLLKEVLNHYNEKSVIIKDRLKPFIQRIFETESHKYKRILVPVSDGQKHGFQISADLEQAYNTNGDSIIKDIEKSIMLSFIDENWKEHLRFMDELKESVQSASFEQKDPLVIYKIKAYELFEEFFSKTSREVIPFLAKSTLMFADNNQVQEAVEEKVDFSQTQTNEEEYDEEEVRRAADAVSQMNKPSTFRREVKKVGRNELCPCGSGKKYKHCHGL